MRKGNNPKKDKKINKSHCFHQVIIPVYIPNREGYFKDSIRIFHLCIESLLKTVHSKTYITIVNNGSCNEVEDYLNNLYQGGKIHEVIHTENIGYINAMLKGIAGHNFPIFTNADADVLFLKGWQEASYSVFNDFPKAGVVCPTPSSRSLRTLTSNIYWDLFFSSKLKFDKVLDSNALIKFAESIGNPNFYNEIQQEKYLTIKGKDINAVVGAGHFVVTYRGEIFDKLDSRFSEYVLGGDSDDVFDIPVVKKGYWRLSTDNNYAYHMGNVLEEWMNDELNKLEINNNESDYKLKKVKANSPMLSFVKNKIFGKFILNKKIMRLFIIWKGLTKQEAENYLT